MVKKNKKHSAPISKVVPTILPVIQPIPSTVSKPSSTITSTSTTVVPHVQGSLYKSRKFFYVFISVSLVLAIYVVNVFLVTKNPSSSPAYLSMFGTILSYISGITAGILGLHSWMSYATTATNTVSNVVSNAVTTDKTYNFTDAQKTQNVAASRANLPGI